jgi:hypothetical protein
MNNRKFFFLRMSIFFLRKIIENKIFKAKKEIKTNKKELQALAVTMKM